MKHIEVYLNIVKKEHTKLFNKIFRETDFIKAKKAEVCFDETGFPYLRVSEEYDNQFGVVYAARFIGAYLDVSSILPQHKGLFYLPFIAVPIDYDESVKKIIDLKLTISHELIHLKDILDLVENEPQYLTKLQNYSLSNVGKVEDLEKSIDFEVWKMVKMETKALTFDFENGANTMNVQFLWMVRTIWFDNLTEFLQFQLHDYLETLKTLYLKKFADEETKVKEFYENAIAKHGTEIFGKTETLRNFHSVSQHLIDKMLGS